MSKMVQPVKGLNKPGLNNNNNNNSNSNNNDDDDDMLGCTN